MTTTAVISMNLSPELGGPIQWDYSLQETIESIKRGIAEAARGEGRYIDDGELVADDDE